MRSGPGDDPFLIGDHLPVAGEPTGESGNDRVLGEDGDDGLFGDSLGEIDGAESGAGNDSCQGGAGLDTASASCETVTGVP